MTITVNKKDFVNALTFVKEMNYDKMFSYYFKWEPGKLFVGSYIHLINCEMKADCEGSGIAAFQDVRELLKRKDAFKDDVIIESDEKETTVCGIKCTQYTDSFHDTETEVEKMMHGPDGKELANIELNKDAALKAFNICSYSESQDSNRYFMTGSCLDKGNLVSTDGRRMAVIPLDVDTSYNGNEYRPIFFARYMISILKHGNSDVIALTYGHHIVKDCEFKDKEETVMYAVCGNIRGYVKCILGTFPRWDKVNPNYSNTSYVDRNTMVSELKAVKPFVDKHVMRIFTRNGYMCCESNIGKYKGKVRILPEGVPEICMNWQYMYDAFSSQLSTDNITMKWSSDDYVELKNGRKGTPLKAVTFGEGKNVIVVMPMDFPRSEFKIVGEIEDEWKKNGEPLIVVYDKYKDGDNFIGSFDTMEGAKEELWSSYQFLSSFISTLGDNEIAKFADKPASTKVMVIIAA